MKDIESAIEGLKGIGVILEPLLKRINHEGLGKEDAAELSEHLKMGAKALEKQIPERPYYLQYNFNPQIGNWNHGIACICYKDEKYCSNCGQKLDWRRLENERI